MSALLAVVFAGLVPGRAQDVTGRPSLVLNGSFDSGLQSWLVDQAWYELPQGSGKGTSRFEVVDALAKEGPRSLLVVGQDNRGIAMQDVRIRPEPHRLSGWIRCQGLGEASATLNIEWIGEGGKWLAGEAAGSVVGDADWTFVSRDVTPVEGAVVGRVECLTNSPNSGAAWFDDLRLINLGAADATPPPPVECSVRASRWLTGALNVEWTTYQAPDDLAQYRVRWTTDPVVMGSDWQTQTTTASAKAATLHDLTPGLAYHVAVEPVDLYGNAPPAPIQAPVTPGYAGAPLLEAAPLLAPEGALLIRLRRPLGGDDPRGYLVRTECGGKRGRWKCGAEGRIVAHGLPADSEVTVEAAAVDDEDRVATATSRTLPAAVTAEGRAELSGVVTSAGAPVGGATIALVFSSLPRRTVASDAEGRYHFDATGTREPTAARLFVSAPGVRSAHREVLVGAGKARVDFGLQPAAESPVRLWTAPPTAQVFQDQDAPPQAAGEIDLVAGRNEAECAQIVARALRPVEGARVVFEDLQQQGGPAVLPAEACEARFVEYVHVTKNSTATPPEELVRQVPADFPDELGDDEACNLAEQTTQPVFLTFGVPAGAAPGIYTGNVYLQSAGGLDGVPVKLEVLPVDFPENPRLWVVNWFSADVFTSHYGLADDSPEWWAMLREYARMFHRYHQNAVTVSPGLCRIWVEADGSRTYDWSRFDRWCETFLSEGVGRLTLGHLGGRTTGEWECPEFALADRPATVRATGGSTTVPLADYLQALEQHLDERGWLDIAYQHIADEPIPVNVESWKAQAARVHQAAPRLKRMDAIQVPDLRGFCELWVPQLNYFDQWYADYRRWQQAGEMELWLYVAWVPQGKYTNRLIDAETIKPRLIHWMTYLYGATGYLHWGLNHWNLQFGYFAPGDEWMVWPGRDLPNPSLRYEAQRDGLEDCEYLAMLEDAQGEAIEKLDARGFQPGDRPQEIGRRIVRTMTDYTRSHGELEAARREVLRGIIETRSAPVALVHTEPSTAQPIAPGEVSVFGVTEPGCAATVNGQPVEFDGNRFLARTRVTAESPRVTVLVRKGRTEKTLVREFAIR
jgi:hypothetical protein